MVDKNHDKADTTRINGVPAQTGFRRTLTKTIYISVIFSTLNPILSVTNLSRLECAGTPFILVYHRIRNNEEKERISDFLTSQYAD